MRTKSTPGPKPGYKQSADHVAKRKRFGKDHPNWKGGRVSEKGGRSRALRAFPVIGPCVRCGSVRSERHHRDGNTANNSERNVVPLCRRCHMLDDGRIEEFIKLARKNQPRAVAARWRKAVLPG